MSVTSKSIKEDISRSRAAMKKNDYLKTLDGLAKGFAGFARAQIFGRDKFEIQVLLEEAMNELNGLAMIQRLFPQGMKYVKGKEMASAKVLMRLRDKLKVAMEKARVAKKREDLGRLDELLIKAGDLIKADDPLEARKLFRKAADEYGNEIDVLFSDIGTRLVMAGLFSESHEYLNRALEKRAADARAHNSMIMSWEGLGETDKAIDAVKEAMRRLGQTEALNHKLAQLYFGARVFTEAHKYATHALEQNPLNREAEKIIKKCEPKIFAKTTAKGDKGTYNLDA